VKEVVFMKSINMYVMAVVFVVSSSALAALPTDSNWKSRYIPAYGTVEFDFDAEGSAHIIRNRNHCGMDSFGDGTEVCTKVGVQNEPATLALNEDVPGIGQVYKVGADVLRIIDKASMNLAVLSNENSILEIRALILDGNGNIVQVLPLTRIK
jgi:hypothetical protein